MDYKKIPYYGLFAALAILMGYVEMMIPVPVPIPGVKLGLANVIIIIMMYFMDITSYENLKELYNDEKAIKWLQEAMDICQMHNLDKYTTLKE